MNELKFRHVLFISMVMVAFAAFGFFTGKLAEEVDTQLTLKAIQFGLSDFLDKIESELDRNKQEEMLSVMHREITNAGHTNESFFEVFTNITEQFKIIQSEPAYDRNG